MNEAKFILKSWTAWFNVIGTVVAVAGLLQGQEWIAANPQAVAILGSIVTIGNIILRFKTRQPVFLMRGGN